jgi:4-amino-4-deoxy-L-arabinose transferase-like glycosyltransferase
VRETALPMKTERVTTFLVMMLISLLSLALLGSRPDAPYDGYLAFNEAWYSLIAENYEYYSWFEPHPYEGVMDLNVPPFFSYVLNVAYAVFGSQEWVFRLIPIISGMLCVVMTFFIGRALYGLRAGFAAAALLAVCPVFVLTARNVQADGLFLCLMLYGFHFYVQYLQNRNPGTMVFSAIMFGCALFTKQVAIVALAALAISELINNNWKILQRKRLAIFIGILAVAPGQYYLYHLIKNPGALFQANRYGALNTAELPSLSALATLGAETFFGLGPALCALGAAALAASIAGKRRLHPIVIWPLALYALFFVFVHKHTYYMLPMAPFLCIIAGRYLSNLRWKAAGGMVLALAAAFGLVQSLMVLGALKFGYNRFEPLCEHVRSSPGKKVLVAENSIMLRYEPVLRFYCRGVVVQDQEQWSRTLLPGLAPLEYGDESYFFLMVRKDERGTDSQYMHIYDKRIMGPALFGRMIYYVPLQSGNRMRTFIPGVLAVKPAHSVPGFSMQTALVQPGMQMFELPPGYGVYKRTNTERMHGAGPVFFAPLPPELTAYEDEVQEQDQSGPESAAQQDHGGAQPVIHPGNAPEGD